MKDELIIKKFWLFYIWNAFCSRSKFQTEHKELIVDLSLSSACQEIIDIITNKNSFAFIEKDLENFNKELRKNDQRLVITFDQLDNIVKPVLWNDIISPLVKIVMRFTYSNIHPKLFLRRDLYDRLGNLTNKNSFNTKLINLEWSQDEIFSYFLKIVFSYAREPFFEFLSRKSLSISNSFITSKLKTKEVVHNQLPLEKYLIEPIINAFFGDPKNKKNSKTTSTAYEDLYRNIQSADKTVNLRPFIDLLTNAIQEQEEQDASKGFRRNAIIGLAYCTSRNVRKNAVKNYLEDLWNEQGNEFIKCFCIDFSNNNIPSQYKKSWLAEEDFENLLSEVKILNRDNEDIQNGSIDEFKQVLIATKIITPYMVGNKTRYGIAFLYTNYLGV